MVIEVIARTPLTRFLQRARAHCNACDRLKAGTKRRTTLQDADAANDAESIYSTTPKSVPLSPSHDTAETEVDLELACCRNSHTGSDNDDDDKECPICMESFAESDVLSWSPTTSCQHVFHHECLKEWLLYHDNCPYCRVTVMPIDQLTADNANNRGSLQKTKQEELLKLSRERSQRVRTTYYCVDHGLVVLPRPLSPRHCSTSSLRRFMSTRVTTTDLASIRGTRSVADDVKREIAVAPSTDSTDAEATRVTFTREVQPLRTQPSSL